MTAHRPAKSAGHLDEGVGFLPRAVLKRTTATLVVRVKDGGRLEWRSLTPQTSNPTIGDNSTSCLTALSLPTAMMRFIQSFGAIECGAEIVPEPN